MNPKKNIKNKAYVVELINFIIFVEYFFYDGIFYFSSSHINLSFSKKKIKIF